MSVLNFARNYDFLFLSSNSVFIFFFLRLEYIIHRVDPPRFFFDRPLILTPLLQPDSIQCTIKANHPKRSYEISIPLCYIR